jgi:Restriction endonuclease
MLYLGGDDRLELLRAYAADPAKYDDQPNYRTVAGMVATGLLARNVANLLEPTDALARWSETGDPLLLASTFHDRVQFFGELASFLAEPRTSAEIRRYAEQAYRIRWKTLDQIHRRLVWLRELGLVQMNFDQRYVLLDAGRDWISSVAIEPPLQIAIARTELTLERPPNDLAIALADLDDAGLASRRVPLGYIIGGATSIGTTLQAIINFVGEGTSTDDFDRFCLEKFNVNPSSVRSGLSFLVQTGLMARIEASTYAASPMALVWAGTGSLHDLARLLHCRLRFFGEILAAIPTAETTSELLLVAQERFGIESIRHEDVRTRLQVLRALGLLEEIFGGRHELTADGAALCDELTLEQPTAAVSGVMGVVLPQHAGAPDYDKIVARLHQDARNSAAPADFEATIQEAFLAVGFESQLIGGSGNTDVLISTLITEAGGYSVAIDAKSTSGGPVSESHVNLAVLAEHRRKHNATYSAVVAWEFAPRLIKFAADNSVALFTVDTLARLLHHQTVAPLALSSMEVLFRTPGLVSLTSIEHEYMEASRDLRLIRRTLEVLSAEALSNDAVTKGALGVDGIYLVLRAEPDAPTTKDLERVLGFLESSFVRAVVKARGGYRVVEAPTIAGHRLQRLADMVKAGSG